MKTKLSVTVDETKLDQLDSLVKTGSFRNRSHIVEYALEKIMKYSVNPIKDEVERDERK